MVYVLSGLENISRKKWRKAEGRHLLNLRIKVNDLERQLTFTKNQLHEVSWEVGEANARTAYIEKEKDVLRERNSYLESKHLRFTKEHIQKDRTILLLKEKVKTLISKNSELEKELSNLKKR